jgi:hypothetical protein
MPYTLINNRKAGAVHLGKLGILQPGETCQADIDAADLRRFLGDGIELVGPAPASEASTNVPSPEAEQQHLAKYGDKLGKGQAVELCAFYGIGAPAVGSWLTNGEIEGAAKEGDAQSAPWDIPKTGLLARIAAFKETGK